MTEFLNHPAVRILWDLTPHDTINMIALGFYMSMAVATVGLIIEVRKCTRKKTM